jgi:hypothetical protein
MPRSHHLEISVVQRGNLANVEPLGESDRAGVEKRRHASWLK